MAKKRAGEKLFGKIVAGSEIGRMAEYLSDGKPHSKHIKPKTGRITNKGKRIQEWGTKSKLYTLAVGEDGSLQMTIHEQANGSKPAKKKSSSKNSA